MTLSVALRGNIRLPGTALYFRLADLILPRTAGRTFEVVTARFVGTAKWAFVPN